MNPLFSGFPLARVTHVHESPWRRVTPVRVVGSWSELDTDQPQLDAPKVKRDTDQPQLDAGRVQLDMPSNTPDPQNHQADGRPSVAIGTPRHLREPGTFIGLRFER
jgi:hypothetical protein